MKKKSGVVEAPKKVDYQELVKLVFTSDLGAKLLDELENAFVNSTIYTPESSALYYRLGKKELIEEFRHIVKNPKPPEIINDVLEDFDL